MKRIKHDQLDNRNEAIGRISLLDSQIQHSEQHEHSSHKNKLLQPLSRKEAVTWRQANLFSLFTTRVATCYLIRQL